MTHRTLRIKNIQKSCTHANNDAIIFVRTYSAPHPLLDPLHLSAEVMARSSA
jgi:hypothetical protein